MYYHSDCRIHSRPQREVRPTRSGVACGAVSRWATVFAVGMSTFATAGCYTAKPIPLRQISEYPVRESVSHVTVAAEPFRGRACAKVFNHRINDKGFLPVLILAENKGDSRATLLGSEIQLEDEAGQVHRRVPANVVAAKFERKPGVEAVFFFGLLSFMDASQHNDKLHADWAEKELGQRVIIRPHTTVHGIAYFELKNRSRGGPIRVIVPLIDEAGQYHRVSLTLP